jgi:membrane protein DedA with SNARE-associated domain
MLLQYLIEYQTLGYILIFLLTPVAGDIVLFTSGFLVYQGIFGWDKALLAILLGVAIGDNLWYVLGETIKENSRIGRFIKRLTEPFDEHLKNRTARTIFFAKFTYGLYQPMLLKAGQLRLPFKEFLKGDILASIVWIILVGGLGFVSGASFYIIRRYLRYTEISLLVAIVIFILISRLVANISKKEL